MQRSQERDVAFMDEEAFKLELARRAIQDPAFRAALLADPKGTVERQLGQPLPDSLAVEVVQETNEKIYVVLPLAIAEAEDAAPLSDTTLEQIAGGTFGSEVDYRHDGPLNRALNRRAS